MPKCEDCPYDDQGSCSPEGAEDADLMIIGEGAGAKEIIVDTPFVGPSGDVLDGTLDKVGIDRDDCYITNIVLCQPEDNETPTTEAIDACSNRLQTEINEVNPDYILTLGATASKVILETSDGIHSLRGKVYEKDGRKIIPSFHPTMCLRASSTYFDFHFDLEKLVDVMNNNYIDTELNMNYRVIDTWKGVNRATNYMGQFNEIAVDVETTGLDWRNCDLLQIGFATKEDEAIIIDWDNMDRPKMARLLLNGFFESDLSFIFHNGQYDYKVMKKRESLVCPVDYDTMILHHIGIDERSGRKIRSLDKLSKQYLNYEGWGESLKEYMEDDDKTLRDADREDVYEYLSKDVGATLRLFNIFREEIDEVCWNAYERLIRPSIHTVIAMEMNGMKVNESYRKRLQQEYEEKISDYYLDLVEIAEEKGWDAEHYVEVTGAKSEPEKFNPNSDQQLWHVLYDLFELPLYEGDRTANSDARKHFMDQLPKEDSRYEFLDKLNTYKGLKKLNSVYIKGMKKYIDNGRVYSSLKFSGTRSGRLSSSQPNLQNIPKDPQVKNIFCAKDGYKLMECDFSQNELRTLAELSQDGFMMESYYRGDDLHDEMTRRIFGSDWHKGHRNITKRITFGLIYGAGTWKLAKQIGTSQEQAQEWIDYWAETAPQAWEYLQKMGNKHRTEEYLETYFGRRFRFGLITHFNRNHIINQSRNIPIQSVAWDLTMLAGNEVYDYLQNKEAQLINAVHDSLLIEYHHSLEDKMIEIVPVIMENTAESALDAQIPWVADVAIDEGIGLNSRWGNLEEI